MKRMAACLLAVIGAWPLASFARSYLHVSLPAKDSTVTVSPEKLVLMFNETVELTSLTVQKSGDRNPVKIPALPSLPSRPLTVKLPKLAAGVYTVSYWVMNADLRETRGSFEFTLASGPEWPRARRIAESVPERRK